MTVGELRAAFEAFVDDTVDNSVFLIWLNDAIQDASLKYSPMTSVVIDASALEYTALPADFLSLIEVLDTQGELCRDFETTEWGSIRFATAGTYTVHYHRMANALTANDDNAVPDLPTLMHSPLYIFAASRYWDRESMGDTEESDMSSKLMRQYENAMAKIVAKLRTQRKRRYSFVPEA